MKIIPLIIGLGSVYAMVKIKTKKPSNLVNTSLLKQQGFYFTNKILAIDKNQNIINNIDINNITVKLINSEPAFLHMYQSFELFDNNVENYLFQFMISINPYLADSMMEKSNNKIEKSNDKITNIMYLIMVRIALNFYTAAIQNINPNINKDFLNGIISKWETNKIYSYGITPYELKSAVTKLENTGKYP